MDATTMRNILAERYNIHSEEEFLIAFNNMKKINIAAFVADKDMHEKKKINSGAKRQKNEKL